MTYTIPKEILIGKQSYHIRNDGDYRMVLDCFAALEDIELSKEERIEACLLLFYDLGESEGEALNNLMQIPDLEVAVQEMFRFFNGGRDTPAGASTSYKLIDWEQDSQMICSAINKVANKEIRAEEYIHWWTFLGYYMAVGESALSTVVSIRDKIMRGKKLEKHEQAFRRENPQYFVWNSKSVEDRELDEYVRSLWNSDKKEDSADG